MTLKFCYFFRNVGYAHGHRSRCDSTRLCQNCALVSLINEVLDQAKIESGRLELEAVRFDLRAILDDVLSLFSGKSPGKGVEVASVSSSALSLITFYSLL
jgi:K+-sensing histidine kinase KdpD